MFFALLKKDFRLVLSNPVLLSIVTLLPLLIILIFGLSMRSYMDGNFGTFDDCKVLYYEAEPTPEILETFDQVSAQIAEKTGAVFEQTDDYTEAQKQVERSEAVAVIKLEADGFDYFRSTFNEPYGGDIIRSLFTQLTNTPTDSPNFVQSIQLDVKKTNSDVYYTFIGMVFAIMFMGSFVSNSYGKDFSSQTLDRMYLSRAGKLPILGSKLLCGFLCGILQMAIALPIATAIFDIDWSNNAFLILLVFTAILVFSLAVGSVVGVIIKNETLSYLTFCEIVLFSSYLGGAVTPVYLLKKIPVVKHLIKLSPVYWANESITKLYNGTVDHTTRNCLLTLLLLSIVLLCVNWMLTSKSAKYKLQTLFLRHNKGV